MQNEKWKRVPPKAFREGDVYIDYPFEHVKFRYEKDTQKHYRRFYGKRETEVPHDSEFFAEGLEGGWQIDAEAYFQDRDIARHEEGGGLEQALADALTPACGVCGQSPAEVRDSALKQKPYLRCETCLEEGAESIAGICLKIFLEGGPASVEKNDPGEWWPHGVKSYADGRYIGWPEILAVYPRYAKHYRKH